MGGEQLANADAKRTVLRLKQKLEGLEGGAPDEPALPCCIFTI